jgi:hypothetical protein
VKKLTYTLAAALRSPLTASDRRWALK